jgi:hypothetical protein
MRRHVARYVHLRIARRLRRTIVVHSRLLKMKMMLDLRPFVPFVASLLLGGCASTPVVWTRTDGMSADMTADLRECKHSSISACIPKVIGSSV